LFVFNPVERFKKKRKKKRKGIGEQNHVSLVPTSQKRTGKINARLGGADEGKRKWKNTGIKIWGSWSDALY